ncbi:Uncharacterised protein [Bordetella pertussis]|nr:Uncharacterised protein [Bordetella pertussis]
MPALKVSSDAMQSSMAMPTWRPCPLDARSSSAAVMAWEANWPVIRSAMEVPILVGRPAGSPVMSMMPDSPWMIRS